MELLTLISWESLTKKNGIQQNIKKAESKEKYKRDISFRKTTYNYL